eukprot:7380829-Prymnesium_polylepis.1
MLTSPCSARVGSLSPASSPSTRRAAARAVEARSFIEHVGMNLRSRSAARASTRLAFSISAATSCSESRKAVACASAVLPGTAARSSAMISILPLTRRASSSGAAGRGSRSAATLHRRPGSSTTSRPTPVRCAGRVEHVAPDGGALAVDVRAGHLLAAARQLHVEEASEDEEERRHLPARDAQLQRTDDRQVDLRAEGAALEEPLLTRLGDRLVRGGFLSQCSERSCVLLLPRVALLLHLLAQRVQLLARLRLASLELLAKLLVLLGDRVDVVEPPLRARLVRLDLLLELLDPAAQREELL